MSVRAVIVGASGYSGAELASILLGHPAAEIVGVFGSARRDDVAPQSFADIFTRFRGRLELPVTAADPEAIAALKPDAVFLATPHEASHDLTPQLLARGIKVLDLSAAFRLKTASLYPKHYGFEHHHPALLAEAVYGLPELHRADIRRARLIAVPGCYPTASILALEPLARAGLLATSRPIIDATSGVSGAGRSATQKSLFCEVSLQPYNVLKHRHNPEIDSYVGVPTLFTPHLGAFDRGILATIHADLKPGGLERVASVYQQAYAAEPFVRLCPPGQWPSVADVRGTNFCDIAFATDPAWNHLIVVSAIDNLVKGAAGQAVQCINLMFDLPEDSGLFARTPPHR